MVEWFDTRKIREIDEIMETHYPSREETDSWTSIGGSHYSDYKYEASKWIRKRVEILEEIQEMVDNLPDEEITEYEEDPDD